MNADLEVGSIVRRPPLGVHMDDSIQAVERFLVEHDLVFAPVLEPGGTAIGVLSSTDLLRLHARQGDVAAKPAWQLCTYKPVSVPPATRLADVTRLMHERRVHHVLVADGDRVLGIVSALDLARALAGGTGA